MKTHLLSTCCQAPAKPDKTGANVFFCTKCVKGCSVKGERIGFGSQPSNLSSVRKPTGELKLLGELIKERGAFSEISGEPLEGPDHERYHWQIFHVLGKGEYPELRLLPENVLLSTWQEQDAWTKRKESLRGLPHWTKVFELEQRMKLAVRTKGRAKPFDTR